MAYLKPSAYPTGAINGLGFAMGMSSSPMDSVTAVGFGPGMEFGTYYLGMSVFHYILLHILLSRCVYSVQTTHHHEQVVNFLHFPRLLDFLNRWSK